MRVWVLVEWKLEDEPTTRVEDEPWGVVAALSASAAKNPDEDGSWFLHFLAQ